MSKTAKTAKMLGRGKIIDDIFCSWCLKDHGIDSEVISDIKSAIQEAYMAGCLHGGLDRDIHEEAIDFFRK